MAFTEDGITTYDGADEPLVALWDGGVVTAGTIRDLCTRMRDVVDGEEPVAVYVRDGDELVEVTFRSFRPFPGQLTVSVNRTRTDGRVALVSASIQD